MEISSSDQLKMKSGEVQTTQQAQGTTSTESTQKTGKTSEPVKMVSENKIDPETLKNNEIVNFMNSDEFKAMSDEEQLKYFKEHYCTGLTDEQTSALFNNAREMAKEAAQITALGDDTKTGTQTDKDNKQTTAVQQQTEQTILEELQTVQKIENPSRKDVYNYLLGKEVNGTEMTDAEKSVLKTYKSLAAIGHPDFNEGNTAANAQQTTNTKALEAFNSLVNSANLTPQEKVTEYMKLYLKNDPEYNNLSKEEKTKKCNEEVKKLVKIVSSLNGSNKTVLSDDDTLLAFSATALLTDLAEKGEKVSDLPTSSSALNDRVDKAISKQLRTIIKTLADDERFKGKSNTEQIIEIGNLIYKDNPEYQGKNDNEKCSFLIGELSKKIPEIAIMSQIAEPEVIADIAVAALKYVADNGEDYTLQSLIDDFKAHPKRLVYTLKENYHIKDESVETMKDTVSLFRNVQAKYHNLKFDSVLEYLNGKRESELSDTELKVKKFYNATDRVIKTLQNNGVDASIIEEIKKKPRLAYKMVALQSRADKWESKHPGEDFWTSDEFDNIIRETFADVENSNYSDKAQDECIVALGALRGLVKNKNDLALFNEKLAPYRSKMDAKCPELFSQIDNVGIVSSVANKNAFAVNSIIDANNSNTATAIFEVVKETNDPSFQTDVGYYAKDGKHSKEYAISLATYDKERAAEIIGGISEKSGENDSGLKNLTQIMISHSSAENQNYFSNVLVNLNNAAVTEGLAAAYNSVDDSVKASYKQALDNAISNGNYTAEQKASFAKALKTGTVSTSSSAKPAETAQASAKTSAATSIQSAQAAQTAQTAQTAALNAEIKAAQKELSSLQTAEAIQSSASSFGITTGSSSKSASASATSAAEAKKTQAMDNAATTASNIDKAVKDWEKQHNTKLSDDQIKSLKTAVSAAVVDELLNDPKITTSSTEVINTLVSNATSVSDLYTKLIDLYGTKVQDKFIEVLARNGSSNQISSFAQNTTNSDIIRDLFLKCDSSVLKTELLNMLPPTSIAEMLRKGQIQDYSMVDYKVLSDYITASISSMSNTEFNNYLKFLPLDERNRLCRLRLKTNPASAADTTITGEFAQTIKNDSNAAQIALNSSASNGEVDASSPFLSQNTKTGSETDALSGVTRGSDEWQRLIRERQSGIKVPPSERYDTAANLNEDFWDIGSNGSTKVKFRGDYDKQQHKGALYWG